MAFGYYHYLFIFFIFPSPHPFFFFLSKENRLSCFVWMAEMDTQKDYSSWRAPQWRINSSINWTLLQFYSPVAPLQKLLALLRCTDVGCMLCLMTLSRAVQIHKEPFSLWARKPMNYLNWSPASHYVDNYVCQWFDLIWEISRLCKATSWFTCTVLMTGCVSNYGLYFWSRVASHGYLTKLNYPPMSKVKLCYQTALCA